MNLLQAIFEESNVAAIVVDNAKSHSVTMKPRVVRHGSMRAQGEKRSSRWECISAKKDNLPVIKSIRASSSSKKSSYESDHISLGNVLKPVRRRSLDNYKKNNEILDQMKEMNTSLSSMNGVIDEALYSSTASILSMALDRTDLLDDGFVDMVEIHTHTLDATAI